MTNPQLMSIKESELISINARINALEMVLKNSMARGLSEANSQAVESFKSWAANLERFARFGQRIEDSTDHEYGSSVIEQTATHLKRFFDELEVARLDIQEQMRKGV